MGATDALVEMKNKAMRDVDAGLVLMRKHLDEYDGSERAALALKADGDFLRYAAHDLAQVSLALTAYGDDA